MYDIPLSRRRFLTDSSLGFGALALSQLLSRDGFTADRDPKSPLAAGPTDFPGTAKNVIFLFMQGGPSHLETFDPKPELIRLDGKPLPGSFRDIDLAQVNTADGKLMGATVPFERRGESGLEISNVLPHIAQHADDLAGLLENIR